MDITFDGHWVLTTSDFFLTVAPTQFKVGSTRQDKDRPKYRQDLGHAGSRLCKPPRV